MRSSLRLLPILSAAFLLSTATPFAQAQSARAVAASARVLAPVDEAQPVKLQGHVPQWATSARDLGVLAPSRRLDSLLLVLSRSPEVQAAFDQLLVDQQNPGSPRYHQWLTPEENAKQYGVAPSDVAAVTDWLRSKGLSVDDVAAGGVFITFSGPVSAVENAFSTSLHSFSFDSASRYAPTVEPAIPAAIANVVTSVGGLAELYMKSSLVKPAFPVARNTVYPESGGVNSGFTPYYSLSSNTVHLLSPGDFSLIYDINSVYSSGITGTGYRVAVLGSSRVDPADVTAYETLFSLPAQQPTVVILPASVGGSDPGITNDGNQDEATLDVDRVLATAPGAGTDLLITANGLQFSKTFAMLQYNISTLNDPVQNLSFGLCEASGGALNTNTYDNYFKTAAAQGISTFVSSGDTGAAGCDTNGGTIPTTQSLSTNLLCSSSYATCVGGTEFADFASPSTYWASTNSTTKVSALSYIPEGTWNEPSYVSSGVTKYQATATGGGISTVIARPTWQTGTGVPAGSFRLTPDMSLAASTHNGYVLCLIYNNETCATGGFLAVIGGTSASAPSMAGLTALLNQKLGTRQGNLNPLFYRLAATPANGAFHDITPATSGVSSCDVTVPSMCNNSTPSPTSLSGGLSGYALTTGYDLSTGLGTLDVAKFLIAAATPYVSTTLALTASANPITGSQTTTFTATLTPSSSPAAPTGTVQFLSNGVALGSPVTLTAAGTATTPALSFAGGSFAITAVYSGDTTFITSTSSTLTLVSNANASTTTALTVAPSTITSQQTSTLTATVSSTTAGTISGTVQFYVNGVAKGAAVTVGAGGVATLSGQTFPIGANNITAIYSGNSTFASSTSAASVLTVTAVASATALVANPTSATTTQTVTLTATVSGSGGTPTGTVTFKSGATTLGTPVTLAAGVATYIVPAGTLAVGANSITAVYSGDTVFGTSTSSVATVTLTATPSTTSLTVASAAISTFQSDTLTATVSVTGGTPTGTVQFKSGATNLGSPVTVSAGSAVYVAPAGSLSIGTNAITAVYSGDAVFSTSTSAAATITVSLTASSTALTVPATVTTLQTAALSATVTGTGGAPTGTVQFLDGLTVLNTATLSAGAASYTVPAGLSVGAHSITAKYSGDANFLASTSAIGTITVTTAPVLNVSSSPASLTLTAGAASGNTSTVTVTSVSGPAPTVSLSCAVTASFSITVAPTCSFSAATLNPPAGGTATSTLTIGSVAPHAIGGQQAAMRSVTPTLAVCLLGLLGLPLARRRNWRALASLVFLAGAFAGLAGCGGGGSAASGTPAKTGGTTTGTYTVTVTAASTGAATQTSTITLAVQ